MSCLLAFNSSAVQTRLYKIGETYGLKLYGPILFAWAFGSMELLRHKVLKVFKHSLNHQRCTAASPVSGKTKQKKKV